MKNEIERNFNMGATPSTQRKSTHSNENQNATHRNDEMTTKIEMARLYPFSIFNNVFTKTAPSTQIRI